MLHSDDNVTKTLDPWLLTPEQLDSLEHDAPHMIGPGVEWVLRPNPRPDQARIAELISGLPWHESVEQAGRQAFSILVDTTVAGGALDPTDDQSDVPWAAMLRGMLSDPVLASKRARQCLQSCKGRGGTTSPSARYRKVWRHTPWPSQNTCADA